MYMLNSAVNTMPRQNKLSKYKVCCFCGLSDDDELKFGKFYEHGDIITHYYCLLLSSNMEQRGNDNEGILGFLISDIQKELRRGKKLICTYCKKNGASLGCCNTKCKRQFHYPCGLNAGSLNQFFGEFRSFCIKHRPQQKIDALMKNELTRINEVTCYICYDPVDPYDIINTIWAPCCKKNTWFHKKCVQQLAISTGYFFKCPLCNDKKSFHKTMLEFGIFIPSQDASWELVPNAFEELLYRHDECNAPICLCPKGRKHTSFNAKWELVLCRTCGSQGIHMICGQLKWANPLWECSECISILGKFKESTNSCTRENVLQNNSDLEDSDSDISVGKDSPVPFITSTPISDSMQYVTTIKQRPGPLSFKLKQLKPHREIQNLQLACSSKQQLSGKVNSVLELENIEECNFQSICNKESAAIKSESLLMNENKNSINSVMESSKLQSPGSADTDIILDNKDDIIQHMKNSEDTRLLNQEIRDINSDFFSNIKITNIVSLAAEEFKNLPSMEVERKISSTEFQNEVPETYLKRKFEETTFNSTTLLIDKTKKMKTSGNTCEEKQTFPCISVDIKNTCKSIASISNGLTTYDKNYLQTMNNNEKHISTNVSNLQNLELCTEVQQSYSKKKNLSLECTCNIKRLLEINPLNCTPSSQMNTLSEYEKNEHGCIRYTVNETDKNIKIDSNIKNHNRDADISPTTKSSSRDFSSEQKISCTEELVSLTHSYSMSEKLDALRQQESKNNINMVTISTNRISHIASNDVSSQENDRNIEPDYSPLITEYIHLRDLKFRVCNSNNLQMILYNKFFVNINVKNTARIKSTRFDALIQSTVQQKGLEVQSETSPSLKSENILHSISSICNKDKTKYVNCNDQCKSCHDDTKENMDPVAVPCKSVTGILFTNTNLDTCNLMASKSNNNQNEDRNSIHYRDSIFKGIGKNSKENNQENNNLINYKNNLHDSMTLVQPALMSENHTNLKSENRIKNTTAAQFKIRIDLTKIQKFIDSNPSLFLKHKSDDGNNVLTS